MDQPTATAQACWAQGSRARGRYPDLCWRRAAGPSRTTRRQLRQRACETVLMHSDEILPDEDAGAPHRPSQSTGWRPASVRAAAPIL